MCGIVGYVGSRQAGPILLAGLHRLEYRGYDSAGLAVVTDDNGLDIVKRAGKISELEAAVIDGMPPGTCGVGHTRWATHGAPTFKNAHPHTNARGDVAVVHNGIIENGAVLRRKLQEIGYVFQSDTDTEVVVHLIDLALRETEVLEEAVAAALLHIEGTYGLAVVSALDPQKIVAARNGSPLLVGIGQDGEYLLGSDAAAVVPHAKEVAYLSDGDYAVLTPEGYGIYHLGRGAVNRTIHVLTWDLEAAQKGGYEHYMLKEIHEQPDSLRDVMRGRLLEEEGDSKLGGVTLTEDELARIERVIITACGTSWHAALLGEYMLEELARLPVSVEYASEFRYRNPVVEDNTLVIAVSQSGETADTLAALREAKRRGALTMGIVNVVGSTIARETDFGVYLHAGPEIGVASTKAFTSQIVALALFTLHLARRRNLSILEGRTMVEALRALPAQVERTLELADSVAALAQVYQDAPNFLYLGRGYQFPVALEGALKLKEVSYIHAEGYPAAEMKHGPIALIDQNMPALFLAPKDPVYSKVLSNIEEVHARGGRIIAVVSEGTGDEMAGRVEQVIEVPQTLPFLQPVLTTIPLQLLAYHIAVLRGCDVDQPRNLAKSVTVE
jgi:glucosamine--fructose-6-phosphate aminotransferase (isomerizing)